jgi:hypothetical protein
VQSRAFHVIAAMCSCQMLRHWVSVRYNRLYHAYWKAKEQTAPASKDSTIQTALRLMPRTFSLEEVMLCLSPCFTTQAIHFCGASIRFHTCNTEDFITTISYGSVPIFQIHSLVLFKQLRNIPQHRRSTKSRSIIV